jgi:4-amino-4-deoxy-L-arabinose transferase-like glycosyltransferase
VKETSRAPEPLDKKVALALFVLTFLFLWATEKAIGFTRDESVYFAASDAIARWLRLVFQAPSQAFTDATLTQAFDFNHEHPLLMKTLFALSSMLFGDTLHLLRPAAAYRFPAFAVAALIPVLLYLFGAKLYGRTAGLFAALCFFLAPRHFFNAHLACFDVPIASFWLLTVYTFWRAQTDRLYWLWCGLSFGVAMATKHNALFIPFVLGPFALYRAALVSEGKPEARRWSLGFVGLYVAAALLFAVLVGSWGLDGFLQRFIFQSPQTLLILALFGSTAYVLWRLHAVDEASFRALAPIGAMGILGPSIFYLHWPYMWFHPVDRTAWYLNFHATHVHYAWFYLGTLLRKPPFPLEYVFVKTALTLPLSLVVAMAAGLFWNLARALLGGLKAFRAALPLPSWSETLVGANALASILIISHPEVPHFGGVKHWLPSMCFLALLAGERVAKGIQAFAGWRPKFGQAGRGFALPAFVFVVLLTPAALLTWHTRAYGTSSYGELAGGVPGAASLGMQRQFWSNNVTGVLPYINEHAPAGARLWLHEVNGLSFRDYQRNGMLRQDLRPAGGPGDADLAAYQYHQEFREQELNLWQAFGTQKPVYGLYIDETPQVMVYQRP